MENPVVVSLKGYSERSIKRTVLLNLLFGIVRKTSNKPLAKSCVIRVLHPILFDEMIVP